MALIKIKMGCNILCTGWYADDGKRDYQAYGDDIIRSPSFRSLWHDSIEKFIKPDKILVVNSSSPRLPEPVDIIPKEEWFNLAVNPGHAQKTTNKFSGWAYSALMGMNYTLASNADYFLYVEQDCLLYGKNLLNTIESCLEDTPFVFGSGKGTVHPLQLSLFAVRYDYLSIIVSKMHQIRLKKDKYLANEIRFLLASFETSIPIFFANLLVNSDLKISNSLFVRFLKYLEKYKSCITLPFGYGRDRPIDFNSNMFYFQHGTKKEIETYKKLLSDTSAL